MTEFAAYSIQSLHFEVEDGGNATIWFDLDGARFPQPEAMVNMYVGFDDFLSYLQTAKPGLYLELVPDACRQPRHDDLIRALDSQVFDWDTHLHTFLDEHFDLESAATCRLGWLRDRLVRESAAEDAATEGWALLHAAQQQPDTGAPTWDDLKHTIVHHLNKATVRIFPAFRQADADTSGRLREILESYGDRLANEIFMLAKEIR